MIFNVNFSPNVFLWKSVTMSFLSLVNSFKASTNKDFYDINVDLVKFVLEFIIDPITECLIIVFLVEYFSGI